MKKCNYCDAMGPDSMDYCSMMCRSMAREEYLEGAYSRRGRAADEELTTLRAEVERLREAARQVHALTTEETAWETFPGMTAKYMREIHKITKGMMGKVQL